MSAESAAIVRTFEAPPGGVLTRQVGAITGQVEVTLGRVGSRTVAQVRYASADEWYTVAGPAGALTIAEVVQRLTSDPGVDDDGNPAPSRL